MIPQSWLSATALLLSLVAGCSNDVPTGQNPIDTSGQPPPPPFVTLAPGDSILIQYQDDIRIGVDVQAGDTIDVGAFVTEGSDMTYMSLVRDTLTSSDSILAIPDSVRYSALTLYPAAIANYSGVRVFRVAASWKYCAGPTRFCQPSGSYWLRVRHSAPIVITTLDRRLNSVFPLLFAASQPEGTLETIQLWNVGLGTVDLAATTSVGDPVQLVPAGLLLSGPMRQLSSAGQAIALVKSASDTGRYRDTLWFAGVPTDAFNGRAPVIVPIEVRVRE